MDREICNRVKLPIIINEGLSHSCKQSRINLEIMYTSNIGADLIYFTATTSAVCVSYELAPCDVFCPVSSMTVAARSFHSSFYLLG